MNLRRWQLVWTGLVVLWLGGWAAPMVLLMLRGDIEQLHIYLGMWVAVVLIPTTVVYLVALLVGRFVQSRGATAVERSPGRWRSAWLAGSLIWVLLVVAYSVLAPASLNPFARFALPLAAAVALLVAIIPPLLICAADSAFSRMRSRARHR